MGEIRLPKPVMLFCGALCPDSELVQTALGKLTARLGPVAIQAGPWDWDFTQYYRDELGPGIKRWFAAFERFVGYEDLADIKLFTNDIEISTSTAAGQNAVKRRINLDPGIVDLARVVLATTKEHAHRIYLGKGIWADLTLTFAAGQWQIMPWTYPDYRTAEYHQFLLSARDFYKQNRSVPS